MRDVVDANVFISALVFGGVPQQVLDLIQSEGRFLFISQSIIDEVAGTLLRKFSWPIKNLKPSCRLYGNVAL